MYVQHIIYLVLIPGRYQRLALRFAEASLTTWLNSHDLACV